MTRINASIPPAELTNKHLLAEHREIKRIPNCVAKGKYNLNNIPTEFKLGKGHVSFFYNKLLYLKTRYEQLYKECVNRNFNVTYYGGCWENLPQELMNDYVPTENDNLIIKQRIQERLQK
ncbi:MAG: pyrimidine dimer DNA glycosylase/endonuclease V [Flavobacterium sp.]